MIDLHCHALPGIDDGPQTIEDSLALVRAAAQGGTSKIVATPHVNRLYPNDEATIGRLVGNLREHVADAGIAVEIVPGAEIALTQIAKLDQSTQLSRLSLGGGPWLLIEPPFATSIGNLDGLLLDAQERGHRIVLAHPERCAALRRDPKMLRALVRAGMLTSVTAASLTGRFGDSARRFAMAMAREELLHNVASDAHDHRNRPPSISSEIHRAGLGALNDWLTRAVPEAILEGAKMIPPRPAESLSRPRIRWLSIRK